MAFIKEILPNTEAFYILIIIVGSSLFFAFKIIDHFLNQSKAVDDFDRTIFANLLKGLCSGNNREQISSAIMLRRFLNHNSKDGGKDLKFKQEAINIIVSLLRIEKYGEFQKTLSDSISYVESSPNQDFQYVNLQNAYIDPLAQNVNLKYARARSNHKDKMTHIQIDFSNSDFYMSDLSHASFNNLNLSNAVFVQANLFQSVFRNCNLSGTDFKNADLYNCRFDKCTLIGAYFANAKNIPLEILTHLNQDGIYQEEITSAPTYAPQKLKKKIFISCLGNLTLHQDEYLDTLNDTLKKRDIEIIRYTRDKYRSSGQIALIRNEMMDCDGAIIVGFKSISVKDGIFRPDSSDAKELKNINISTPWSGIEAGMACALGLPLLVLSDDKLSDGIFDPEISSRDINRRVLNETTIDDICKWISTIPGKDHSTSHSKTPSDIVHDFYDKTKDGKYHEIERMLVDCKGHSLSEAKKDIISDLHNDTNIERLKIVKFNITNEYVDKVGKTAIVEIDVTYNDGTCQTEKAKLLMGDDKAWHLIFGQ